MLLLTKNAAQKLDRYFIDIIGMPEYVLVEHAGSAVAAACEKYLDNFAECGGKIMTHIFAGKGMNGEDACACARILSEKGRSVTIWDVFPEIGSEPVNKNSQRDICRNLGIDIRPATGFVPSDRMLIVDGIFGTSFSLKKEFSSYLIELFRKINKCRESDGYIIAIDIPSGVDCDTGEANPDTITADETITFFLPKTGIFSYPGRKYSGEIQVDSLGFSNDRINRILGESFENPLPRLIEINMAKDWMPERIKDGYKGTFGSAGLIGGSTGMAGSICLSAMACARCGVGLVYMRVPGPLISQSLAVIPEALISSGYSPAIDGRDAVLIGPGMDKTKQSDQVLWKSILEVRYLVLDAQALNNLSANPDRLHEHILKRKTNNLPWMIMTPHPGEFKRIAPDLADLNRIEAAGTAARRFDTVIVLKGAGTVIAAPDGTIFINSSGNSAMAKGGSGDVLSGMITAFLAQKLAPLYATSLAVYLHGLCGDLAAGETGEYFPMPTDFIAKIPAAIELLSKKKGWDLCRKIY
ncbi:MAG: NAD(P)H-hydrate dehydratase [Saccharofermentanales bacterium]